MNEYKKLFGLDFRICKVNSKDLPVYITAGRSFSRLSFSGIDFILVRLASDERFGVVALDKQAALLSAKYEMPVAFEFENVSRVQRNSLIERNIPFISGSGQIYLPFLGIALSNRFVQHKQINAEKMMPVTQALFLYLIYNGNGRPIMKKDAAEGLGVTKTSISRASEQLEAMGLISLETHGKESHMIVNGKGMELFHRARPYMINPIQRTITTLSQEQFDSYLYSGESALAMNTMLNEPGIPVKAVYKAEIDSDKLPDIDIRWAPDKAAVNIELWKYDPGIFSRNGSIDPISLALCFENNADERIEEAIEKYMEAYKW